MEEKAIPFTMDLIGYIYLINSFSNQTIRNFKDDESRVALDATATALGAIDLGDYIIKGLYDAEKYKFHLKGLEHLSVKQFEILFGMKPDAQKAYRSRVHDPLPYIQLKYGATILYNRVQVTKWFENYKK